MLVTKHSGSVRVDLVGGTLDLEPVNVVLPNVVTLNVATGLAAHVEVADVQGDELEIFSEDYQKTYRYKLSDLVDQNFYTDFFAEMSFVVQLISYFPRKALRVSLKSGAPAGSGLGGSSAMGVTLFSALSKHFSQTYTPREVVSAVKLVESRILNQGVAGYQDYYPALYGGILALRPGHFGVQVEQLYSSDLKNYLENHLTLVYSGLSRASGINNWEVYKGFFDRKPEMREGLAEIAKISHQFYQDVKKGDFSKLGSYIQLEGQVRSGLFPQIAPDSVLKLFADLKLGGKMCGAGGGGCFVVVHRPEEKARVEQKVQEYGMKILSFDIRPPLDVK